MTRSTAVTPRSVPHALIATVLSGILTYVFLATVSRGSSDLGFDQFSVFWAVSLLVGFGLFVPVEQEMARRSASGGSARESLLTSLPIVAVLAVGGATAAAVVALAIVPSASPGFVACFIALGPVSAVQFLARGSLLAAGRTRGYANLLLVDTALRAVLAGAVTLAVPSSGAETFAGVLLVAILAAHAGVLVHALSAPGGDGSGGVSGFNGRATAIAVGGLLGAGIISQLLLNTGPILIQALGATVGAAGAFQAAFNIARIPLFVVVPLQSLLVSPFVRLLDGGEPSAARRFLARLAIIVAVVSAVAGGGALLLGPWIVELVFGAGRSLAAPLVALLVVGACLNGGLVIFTQALVALRRHRFASLTWAIALVAASVAFVTAFLLEGDAVSSTCIAFAVGSVVGFGVAAIELAVIPRRIAP